MRYQSPATPDIMPGLSTVLVAIALGEIGDISRFSAPEKPVAYAGIGSSLRQSGNQNHISKRGSPFLRRAIWLAAFNDPVSPPSTRKNVRKASII